MIPVIPVPHIFRLIGASGRREKLIHLCLYEAKILIESGAVDGVGNKVVGTGKDAFLRDLQAAGNDSEPQCRVILQRLEQSAHNVQHLLVIAVAVGLGHRHIVFVNEKNNRFPVMALQHFCQQQEAVLHFLFRSGGIGQAAEGRFLELADIILLQEIAMPVEKTRDDHGKHVIGTSEVQAIYLPEGNENGGILVHPHLAELPILRDFQILEKVPAVLSDVEEVFQHAHSQGLSEAAGAGDQCHLCAGAGQKLPDQRGLIDIVVATPADFCEVRNADGEVQGLHASSFSPAMKTNIATARMGYTMGTQMLMKAWAP